MQSVSSTDIPTAFLKDRGSLDKGPSEMSGYKFEANDSLATSTLNTKIKECSHIKWKHDTIGAVVSPSCKVALQLFPTESELCQHALQALQRQHVEMLLRTSFA
jgi:hypothetical protein